MNKSSRYYRHFFSIFIYPVDTMLVAFNFARQNDIVLEVGKQPTALFPYKMLFMTEKEKPVDQRNQKENFASQTKR